MNLPKLFRNTKKYSFFISKIVTLQYINNLLKLSHSLKSTSDKINIMNA